jgi:DNA-binding beta-propeller fold protein YncE
MTARLALVTVAALTLIGWGANRVGAAVAGGNAAVSYQRVPGAPFGVAITPDGRYAFVVLSPEQVAGPRAGSGRVLVYSLAHGHPVLVGTIALPGRAASGVRATSGAAGCSITEDGRLLLVAEGQGAVVISVSRAERGAADAVLGRLSPPPDEHVGQTGAIETASSADGRYVFVSLENGNPSGAVSVYDLGDGSGPRFGRADYVGSIPLGPAVVGSALSPDGRYLYVTSELADVTRPHADGTLSVIDLSRAEHGAQHAVLASVPAGHQPVRVAVSPSGSTVWVTARADNRVLAFAADRLLSDPTKALQAQVKVGTAPVGLATFDDGNRLLVADSNRFDARGAHAALTVLNAQAALAHKPATIAGPPAGAFPREIAVDEHNQIALVTNFGSSQLETIQLDRFR